jgi:hypothetical protein
MIDRDRQGKASEGACAPAFARRKGRGRRRALACMEEHGCFKPSCRSDPSLLRCGSRGYAHGRAWRRWPASCRGRSCPSSRRRTTRGVSSPTHADIRVARRTWRRGALSNPMHASRSRKDCARPMSSDMSMREGPAAAYALPLLGRGRACAPLRVKVGVAGSRISKQVLTAYYEAILSRKWASRGRPQNAVRAAKELSQAALDKLRAAEDCTAVRPHFRHTRSRVRLRGRCCDEPASSLS